MFTFEADWLALAMHRSQCLSCLPCLLGILPAPSDSVEVGSSVGLPPHAGQIYNACRYANMTAWPWLALHMVRNGASAIRAL
jgi:hypothetical protein